MAKRIGGRLGVATATNGAKRLDVHQLIVDILHEAIPDPCNSEPVLTNLPGRRDTSFDILPLGGGRLTVTVGVVIQGLEGEVYGGGSGGGASIVDEGHARLG